MAESLGLAWKDVNGHLAERKQILELNVDYKRWVKTLDYLTIELVVNIPEEPLSGEESFSPPL